MQKVFGIKVVAVAACVLLQGCFLLKKKEVDPAAQGDLNQLDLQAVADHPLSPEETEGLINEVGANWFYGQGLGETAVSAGAIVLFPPYAIYVLGNAMLSLNGYEEVRITDALPESGRAQWNSVYDHVTSVPGEITSGVAGEEFRDKEKARQQLGKYLGVASKKAAAKGAVANDDQGKPE